MVGSWADPGNESQVGFRHWEISIEPTFFIVIVHQKGLGYEGGLYFERPFEFMDPHILVSVLNDLCDQRELGFSPKPKS